MICKCGSKMDHHETDGGGYFTCPICGWASTDTYRLTDKIIVMRLNGSSYTEIQLELRTSTQTIVNTLRVTGIIRSRKKSSPPSSTEQIKTIARLARERGMTYGQYVSERCRA